MLESFKYVNHLGEVIEFGKKGLYANYNNLRDYEWSYDSSRSRAENFRKGVVPKTIPIIISADNIQKCITIKNRLYEVCEKDIIAKQKGKLYIGEYYLECYVFSSSKSKYLEASTTINMSLKIVADSCSWVKPETYKFRHETLSNTKSGGKGYDYDYQYDYSGLDDYVSSITLDDIKECDFIITFYGPAVNPSVTIDQNRYSMTRCMLERDDRLEIISKDGTITLYKNDGSTRNMFCYRNRESDIFKKIEPGRHMLLWNGDIDFDLTIVKERGEPLWGSR